MMVPQGAREAVCRARVCVCLPLGGAMGMVDCAIRRLVSRNSCSHLIVEYALTSEIHFYFHYYC